MNKLFRIFAAPVCALLLSACFALAACAQTPSAGEDGAGNALSGTMTFVIDDPATAEADAVFSVSLENYAAGDTAADVLDGLAAEGKVCYEGSRGVFGLMLTAVGTVEDGTDWQGNPAKVDSYILRQDASEGVYLYLYTSVAADQADYDGATSVQYAGKTLVESMQGVSSMTIADGAVILITTIVYGA